MDYKLARERMVDIQLIPRGITDEKVISAFRRIPRHEFIPTSHEAEAYSDYPLPIGYGQTISQPYIVALMTKCLDLKGTERVLEIGSGSGYQAAILSLLAKEVVTVERLEPLAKRCSEALARLNIDNVHVVSRDGSLGYSESDLFDAIIVTCAARTLPKAYCDQLKPGGRIVIPLGSRWKQVLTIIDEKLGEYEQTEVCGCVFVPLIGEGGWNS